MKDIATVSAPFICCAIVVLLELPRTTATHVAGHCAHHNAVSTRSGLLVGQWPTGGGDIASIRALTHTYRSQGALGHGNYLHQTRPKRIESLCVTVTYYWIRARLVDGNLMAILFCCRSGVHVSLVAAGGHLSVAAWTMTSQDPRVGIHVAAAAKKQFTRPQ